MQTTDHGNVDFNAGPDGGVGDVDGQVGFTQGADVDKSNDRDNGDAGKK